MNSLFCKKNLQKSDVKRHVKDNEITMTTIEEQTKQFEKKSVIFIPNKGRVGNTMQHTRNRS
jgi:hypothetical protein